MSRYRHEYKYLMNRIEEELLLIRASGALERDSHAGADGAYQIRSLYFDDYHDGCMYDVENGVNDRSKFRIRYYNEDRSYIRLEKKQKVNGMTWKESVSLTGKECKILAEGSIPEITSGLSGKKKQMFLEMQLRGLIPRTIVTYERIPFVYPAGNVRVTFDRKLTSSGGVEGFFEGAYAQRPVMSPGYGILEVKWDELLPALVKELLQLDSLQWTSFSKYYMCRRYHL